MKNFFIITLSLFFLSCSKQETNHHRFGGSLPDMPNNIPVHVSPSFKKSISTNATDVVERGKQDKAAPTLSFVSPLNGATISGSVAVVISAKDNVAVTETSITINGVKVSNGTSYTWNTTGLLSGFHWLTATAKDAAGNSRTTSITVSINTIVTEPPRPTTGTMVKPMPPVLDQGSEGSCIAFSVGYAARSVEYYNATGTLTTFSPEHLYNQVKFSEDCYVGAAMQPALEYIMNHGILPFASMPYSSTNGCNLYPTALQATEALNYKIAGYYKMYTLDSAMIKGMIRMNKPVIISIAVDNSFINAGPGFIWKTLTSGFLGHSVVICGYDDAKKAYKIMNSWGTGWGDAGYTYIDYDFFTTRTGTYCYAIK
jgi:hypothetical protein